MPETLNINANTNGFCKLTTKIAYEYFEVFSN